MSDKERPRYADIFDIAKRKVLQRWGEITSNPAGVKIDPIPDAYIRATAELIASFGVGVLPADLITIAGSINDQIIIFLTTLNYRAEAFPVLAFQALNPNTATGYPNDSISALSEAYRIPARPTVFLCNVEGSANAVVPSLTPITTVITNATNYTFINPEPIVLNEQGKGSGIFMCTTDGEIPLLPNTIWKCDAYIQGVSTFSNPPENPITLGNDATTDGELHQIRNQTIYRKARCGLTATEGAILADETLRSQLTTVLVEINNSESPKGFPQLPNSQAVYIIPAYTVVVAVAMPDTPANAKALGAILWENMTACNTGYPVDCPEDVKKNVWYEYKPQKFKQFFYLIPKEIVIEFTVVYSPNGYVNPDLESEIKKAIITQFTQGSIEDPRVIGGDPFFINTFIDCIKPFKLYNSQIYMNVIGQSYAETICTPIWQLPVCNDNNIHVITR